MAYFHCVLHGTSSAHRVLHSIFCTVFSPLCFVQFLCVCVFCTAFLVSHPLDSIFPRGVLPDIPHGQSPQATLTGCPIPRTGGWRWRAEPGAWEIPTVHRCWCARKPFGAKCCAREPTGTAGERDSSTSSPATPVSAGGETETQGHTVQHVFGGKEGINRLPQQQREGKAKGQGAWPSCPKTRASLPRACGPSPASPGGCMCGST